MKKHLFVVTIVTLVLLLAMPSAMAQKNGNPNPTVLPPNSDAYGMTYAEWSARWWQWATSMPLDKSPLNDTAPCSEGQLGKVWFLGGSFGSHAQLERFCTIPTGTALFAPLVDVDCSSLELPPFLGITAADRFACVKTFLDTVDNLAITVDGVPLKKLDLYKVISPDVNFITPLDPNNNVLGVPGGTGQLAASGVYVMLAPLSPGEHTIHWKGTIEFFPFTSEQLYHITVTNK